MTRILLCSHDQILTKGLYPVLRDGGYDVEITEHPAEAIRKILERHYAVAVLDSKDIGLNARDASVIIRKIDPSIHIILISDEEFYSNGIESIRRPVSLDNMKETLESILGEYKRKYKKGGIYDTERDRIKSL